MSATKTGSNILQSLDKCERYGSKEAGMVLAHFLSTIDTMRSDIGGYRNGTRHNDKPLLVTGMQVKHLDSPVHILSGIDTSIEVSGKFNRYLGKTPMILLREYLATLEGKQEYVKAVTRKLKEISGNTQLIVPFKPKEQCLISLSDEYKTYKNELADLEYVMWGIDKETNRFQGKIIVKLSNSKRSGGTHKINFEQYGKAFKIQSIENSLKRSRINRESVEMTRFGYVKPLLVKDKNIELALDGVNIYLITNDGAIIVGDWNSLGSTTGNQLVKSLEKHSAYKYIQKNLEFIEKHKRFIAPFGLVETNEIQL